MKIRVELGEVALLFFKLLMRNDFCVALIPESRAAHMVGVAVTQDDFLEFLVAYGRFELCDLLAGLNDQARIENHISFTGLDGKAVTHTRGLKDTGCNLAYGDGEGDQFSSGKAARVIFGHHARHIGYRCFSGGTRNGLSRLALQSIQIRQHQNGGDNTQSD